MRYGFVNPMVSIIDMAAKEKQRVSEAAAVVFAQEMRVPLHAIKVYYCSYDIGEQVFNIAACWEWHYNDGIMSGSARMNMPSPLYARLFNGSLIPDSLYRQMTIDLAVDLSKADENRIEY